MNENGSKAEGVESTISPIKPKKKPTGLTPATTNTKNQITQLPIKKIPWSYEYFLEKMKEYPTTNAMPKIETIREVVICTTLKSAFLVTGPKKVLKVPKTTFENHRKKFKQADNKFRAMESHKTLYDYEKTFEKNVVYSSYQFLLKPILPT